MKIKSIIAKNFKHYETAKFIPSKKTYAIVGPNGRGKTTMTQIIRYALTGELPDNAVRYGCDSLEVTTLLEDGTDFERYKSNTKPSKVKVNGKTATAKVLAAHLETLSGVPLDGMKLSSSSELIEKMKPDEFGSFIMQYIPEDLDYDIIKSYMGACPSEYFEMLEKYIPTKGKFGYEQITNVYNALFEQRKMYRKEYDTFEARIRSFSGEKPANTMEEVNKRLEFILKEEGKFEGLKSANAVYAKALEGQERQKKLIAEYEDKLKAYDAVKKPDPMLAATIEKDKKEINNAIIALRTTINTLNNNVKTFKDTIENLKSPFCPLSEGLVCKTDKTSKREEFEEQIASNLEAIKTINAQIEEKTEAYNELIAKEKEYREMLEKYNQKIRLMQAYESAKKAMPALPTKPEPITEEIDYAAEKAELYSIRDRIIKYEQQLRDIAASELVKKQKETADALVTLFAPKGDVMQKITEYYFGVFESVCNDRAATLKPGFTLKFVPENGIKVLCETVPGRGYIPYESCSSGEKAYVIFLLMDLISNALTGAKIMILDDLDKLDKDAFEALISCIMQPEVQDSYDHIIICGVNHTDTIDTLSKHPEIEIRSL